MILNKEILIMFALHKHIKKRKEEIRILDDKLTDIENFWKISELNKTNPGRSVGLYRNPPPQIGENNVPSSLNRQPSAAVPEKPLQVNQRGTKTKSPNKEQKQGKSGKKRRAIAGGKGGNKRSKN